MNRVKIRCISNLILLSLITLYIPLSAVDVQSSKIVLRGIEKLPATPLDMIKVESKIKGNLQVLDGEGNGYASASNVNALEFRVGGAIGTHMVILSDQGGKIIDRLPFKVDCKTAIEDNSGRYQELLSVLYHTMTGNRKREANVYRFRGKDYHAFVGWLRDHVHTLKGMKYFYPELRTGINLYADSQREDGMIWDNYTHPWSEEASSYWVQRFRYGDFVRVSAEDRKVFTRIPVENDVEYLFIEGIYYTWKATADDAWMEGMLDKALKALNYSRTNPYRWSDQFQLLKRGYTIDTWDFQNAEDAAISVGKGNAPDPMIVTLENTRFGIMFGDNTGMAASCEYLAEMLTYVGREEEASEIRKFGADLKKRIDEVAWNGNFYRHHVPEEDGLIRDLGVDESRQISLSNAYSLNRTISHEQAVNIIRTYQRLREEMPESSPGEFYTIYPPFNKGYGGHNAKWSYMNGGVTSIVAGELALGAFEHGFEEYGVDILNRMLELSKKTHNYLHCTYRGKIEPEPERTFHTIDMRSIANSDFVGKTIDGVMGWTNQDENDLHEFPVGRQIFEKIPFDVIDPAENGRRSCLGMSSSPGYRQKAILDVDHKAQSIYFLHTITDAYYAGRITLVYRDGTRFSDEIGPGKVLNWWYPPERRNTKQMPKMKVAWRGKNKMSDNIGVCVYGLNNPHPGKLIKHIEFNSSESGHKWMVLGVTVSDVPVYFKPGIVSGGIPDNWGAAAVVYALVEGLAGVKDMGVGYDRVRIAPRWTAAGVTHVKTSIKYEACGAYATYDYAFSDNRIEMVFTGNGAHFELQVLLPEKTTVEHVLLDSQPVEFETFKIEKSEYVKVMSAARGVRHLSIDIKR